MNINEKIKELLDLYSVTKKLSDSIIDFKMLPSYFTKFFNSNYDKHVSVLSFCVMNNDSINLIAYDEKVISFMKEWLNKPKNTINPNIYITQYYKEANFLNFEDFEQFFNDVIIGKVATISYTEEESNHEYIDE